MHLHWLKINNIASLYGEHIIDFDELTTQDLFAITGETGAGKSSILNAISLALYGNVYKKQLNQSDLVSLGEREASVELQFSTKMKRYQANWSARVKKKDGSPLIPPKLSRFFYEVKDEGLILLDGKLKPEDVLALDFDQFCKCVILNQGDFAKFLASNFSERRDILEKLYPSDNLELVGGLAKRKWMESADEFWRLQIQTHTIEAESVFDIKTVIEQKNKLSQQIEEIQTELKKIRPGIQIFETLKEQSQRFLATQEKLSDAEKNQQDKTNSFNSALNLMNEFKKKFDLFQNDFEKNFERYSLDEKSYQKLLSDKEKIGLLTKQIELDRLKLEKLQKKSQELDLLIQKLKLELSQLKTHVPDFNQYHEINWELSNRIIFELPRMLKESEQALQDLEIITQKGKDLTNQIETEKQKTIHFTLKDISPDKRLVEINKFQEKLTQERSFQERLKKLQAKRDEYLQMMPGAKQRLEELKSLKEGQHLKHLISSMREHLKTHLGDHCPVCEQLYPPNIQALILENPLELDTVDYNSQFIQLEKLLFQHETQLEAINQDINQIPAPEANLSQKLKNLQDEHQALSEIEKKLALLEGQLSDARENYRSQKERTDSLQKVIAPLLSYVDELTEKFSQWLKDAELKDFLVKLKEDFDIQKIMSEKKQTLQAFVSQKDLLDKEIIELTQTLQVSSKTLKETEQIYQEAFKKFSALYPNGETPEIKLKKLRDEQKSFQHQEQVIQVELRQKERDLSDARANTQRINDQLKQIELVFSEQLNKLKFDLNLDVTISDAYQILDPFLEERKKQVSLLEENLQSISTQIGFLNRQIEDEKERSLKLDHLKKSIQHIESENKRWKRVLDVLGQDDMRTFVLSLVELALIKQTNFELSKLINGRYEILQNQKKGKLTPEFLVVDHWSDGQVRKVSTLSGGETFMVSLAMALALAEMARGRADIDSFFIDEGFGTLDEDSLEDVVGMLQQVRSRGKQIGLITHVKNLSERLPVNLRVVKNDRGQSHTNILYN